MSFIYSLKAQLLSFLVQRFSGFFLSQTLNIFPCNFLATSRLSSFLRSLLFSALHAYTHIYSTQVFMWHFAAHNWPNWLPAASVLAVDKTQRATIQSNQSDGLKTEI